MRPMLMAVTAAAIVSFGFSVASAQDTAPAAVGQTSAGPAFTDSHGMTLYTYSRDMTGFSNCNGDCAVAWPPFLAAADGKAAGDWSIIVRDDGKRQWAYKGKALYAWSKDAKAGDATGDGADKGRWHIAKP